MVQPLFESDRLVSRLAAWQRSYMTSTLTVLTVRDVHLYLHSEVCRVFEALEKTSPRVDA